MRQRFRQPSTGKQTTSTKNPSHPLFLVLDVRQVQGCKALPSPTTTPSHFLSAAHLRPGSPAAHASQLGPMFLSQLQNIGGQRKPQTANDLGQLDALVRLSSSGPRTSVRTAIASAGHFGPMFLSQL